VRLAVSALTAASGLILLGLALFGRPDAYLREARRQWAVLWRTEPAAPDDAIGAQVQALQQQVMQLRDQVAAARPADLREAPATAVAPAAPELATPELAAPELAAPGAAVPVPAPAAPAAPPPAALMTPAPALSAPAVRVEPSEPLAVMTIPERHETVRVTPTPRQRQEVPAVPPDADATAAVLARLRQHLAASAAPPVVQPPLPLQPTQVAEAPASVLLPRPDLVHERLAVVRAALLNGAVADAVRMLQQVQLQLVFRPVTPENNEPGAAGQGAADVARALAALGGNDPRRGLMFVERAMSDVSGGNTGWQQPAAPAGGYAPAYPSR
jgi:hypothetical protein